MSGQAEPDAEGLRVLLAAHAGVRVIEGRGGLAIVGAPSVASLRDPVVRREIEQLARRSGFTHVALELDPPT